jgi:uncharacterized membrane protein YkgB
MQRTDGVGNVGLAILRYGMVALLLMWGAAKFTAAEANAIRTLVEHSPLLSWMYPLFGVQATSNLCGVFEVGVGILIATRRWFPRVSGYASLVASTMFVVTLSFLVTTPDVFLPSSPWGGFLMKDIMFLGAALLTGAEALGAAPAVQHARRVATA